MTNKIQNMIRIGLAYLGVLIGAGFASGKEMLQYYVSFGRQGIWGLVVASILFIAGGIALLEFGSYYKAQEHSEVFNNISSPFVSKIIDFCINLTLFSMGFIMIAGAGTNLAQQFGLPVWVGAALMSLLVMACAFLDVDKITNVIGMITPFVIVFIVGGGIYSFFNQAIPFDQAMVIATESVPTTLPHWLVSTVNYACLSLMMAVSMAVVIGGDQYNPREAGYGGTFGGVLVAILLFMSFFTISLNIDITKDSAMPLLAVFDSLHPILGTIMAFVVFGMIFNTAIGMFYALGKRVSRSKPENFRRDMIILTLVGFALSFVGFESLVAYVFPVIGYIGFGVIMLIIIQWLINFRRIHHEMKVRDRILDYSVRNADEEQEFGRKEAREMRDLFDQSQVDSKELMDRASELSEEIVEDDDYSWEDYYQEKAPLKPLQEAGKLSEEEREALKEELKAEILEELKAEQAEKLKKNKSTDDKK